jgi:YidC/Oxa1 family membrane protein insertase
MSALTQLFNLVIVNPLLNILVFIYSLIGNYGVAILIFTVLIKLVTLPFSVQQQKSMRNQQAVQPELAALQKKYAKDKEKLAQEQMKLYKEKGINPLGGCLPMLIPWPIFIAFYQSVQSVMSAQPEQFMQLSQHVLPALASQLPVNIHFLWLNLAKPDPFYILPALAVITTWVQQKMMTMPSTDPQAQSMNQTMGLMMPLFMGWITLTFVSGLAIYWVTFNIVGIIQQYFITGWGELGKMLPDAVLKVLPGAVPVVKSVAVEPVKKGAPKARRPMTAGDESITAPARRRSVTASDDVVTAPARRRRAPSAADDAIDGADGNDGSQAAPGAATTLPSRKSRLKKPKDNE